MTVLAAMLAFVVQSPMLRVLLSGDPVESGGLLDSLIGMIPKCFNLVGTILSSIVSVDLFAFLIAISLLSCGIGVFVKIKHAASK